MANWEDVKKHPEDAKGKSGYYFHDYLSSGPLNVVKRLGMDD